MGGRRGNTVMCVMDCRKGTNNKVGVMVCRQQGTKSKVCDGLQTTGDKE